VAIVENCTEDGQWSAAILISGVHAHTTSGSTNKEFNFRHDWNSLISDDETLQMRYYSREYFPKADDYVSTVHEF